jgi:hypothetical protein
LEVHVVVSTRNDCSQQDELKDQTDETSKDPTDDE